MRTCTCCPGGFLAAALALPSMAFAQAPARRRSSATPDLSGVWNVKGSPATRYLSWGFSKDEPPMTPWAEERSSHQAVLRAPRGGRFQRSRESYHAQRRRAAFLPACPGCICSRFRWKSFKCRAA